MSRSAVGCTRSLKLVLVGADDNLAVLRDQLKRGLLVGVVGIGLLKRANGFLSAGLHGSGVRASRDLGVAAEALDDNAAVFRARLFHRRQRIVETFAQVDDQPRKAWPVGNQDE